MNTLPKQRMTVDEFLVWAEGRPGRYELESGQVVAMAPERASHAETKFLAAVALRDAVRRAKAPCHVLPDGLAIKVDEGTAYQPDALVYCGERISADERHVAAPVIVVEVLSPSTGHIDQGDKLAAYFSLPSVRHYLIVHPDKRYLIHHARASGDLIETRVLHGGPLRLDPPGLDLTVAEMLPEA